MYVFTARNLVLRVPVLTRSLKSAVILTIVYGLTMIFAKTAILLEWGT